MARLANLLFAPLEAVLVCASAAFLGWFYHRVHLWLWDSQHMWFPVLPGILLGFALGLVISFWGDPIGGKARRLGAPLAILGSAILVFVRFHFDGLHAGPAGGTEWARISHYLTLQSTRTIELAGAMENGHARPEGHWLFWSFLGVEIAAIFIAATFWSVGASVPIDPQKPVNKHLFRKVAAALGLVFTLGAVALFQQGCSGSLYTSYLAAHDGISECAETAAKKR